MICIIIIYIPYPYIAYVNKFYTKTIKKIYTFLFLCCTIDGHEIPTLKLESLDGEPCSKQKQKFIKMWFIILQIILTKYIPLG